MVFRVWGPYLSGFLGVTVWGSAKWEFPKIRGTFLGGPYNTDPTI